MSFSCFVRLGFQAAKLIRFSYQNKSLGLLSYSKPFVLTSLSKQSLYTTSNCHCSEKKELENNEEQSNDELEVAEEAVVEDLEAIEERESGFRRYATGMSYKEPDLNTSLRYMESEAYKSVYGNEPIWVPFKRNFKGQYAPPVTRRTCVAKGKYRSGNPCPVCRDQHILIHHQNTKLLEQFTNPLSGKPLDSSKTGICQMKHKKLLLELELAWEIGLIEAPVPVRVYDYIDLYGSNRVAPSLVPYKPDTFSIPHARPVRPEPEELPIERPAVPTRYQLEGGDKTLSKRRLARLYKTKTAKAV